MHEKKPLLAKETYIYPSKSRKEAWNQEACNHETYENQKETCARDQLGCEFEDRDLYV